MVREGGEEGEGEGEVGVEVGEEEQEEGEDDDAVSPNFMQNGPIVFLTGSSKFGTSFVKDNGWTWSHVDTVLY